MIPQNKCCPEGKYVVYEVCTLKDARSNIVVSFTRTTDSIHTHLAAINAHICTRPQHNTPIHECTYTVGLRPLILVSFGSVGNPIRIFRPISDKILKRGLPDPLLILPQKMYRSVHLLGCRVWLCFDSKASFSDWSVISCRTNRTTNVI